MKTLLAVLLLSALSIVGCRSDAERKAVAPGPAQEPKHGYELAKTWNDATVKAKTAEAEDYYIPGFPSDFLTYEICLNRAQMETLCKNDTNTKACAEKLGPQHIAQCDKLIDELPQLIEKRAAARKAELSR